ncbi:MAG: hypothetical protein JWQ29_2837 [Phenylobacterium sp.]|nr:hypothetical protein [Phenylobacterium sp.]
MEFIEQLRAALRDDPQATMFDFKGRTFARGEIAALADRTLALLDAAGAPRRAAIGVVVRNRPLHAAAMLGLIADERLLTTIYAMQSPEGIAEEIARSGFAAVIADRQDWSPQVREAVRAAGAAGIVLDLDAADPIAAAEGLERAGAQPFRETGEEPGIEILSSGTTGKPKRILFPFRMLQRAVDSVVAGSGQGAPQPDVLTWPYGGIGGMCNLVASTVLGRHTTLMDKFNVPEWIEAVRRHRPASLSGPPAVARMALDAGVAPADLASVKYFFGGGAPMTPDLQAEFEAAYDLKVIWAYGATEFCGTIISWTPELYERHHRDKSGAMGRALPGIQLRVVDVATGEPVAADEQGYLEALVPVVSDRWIRTTDLVRIDADGFVFHHGRGDGAILRGGFKVLPEKIVEALQRHPSVLDAGVIGLPDARLGQAPVAAVELRAGAPRPTVQDLADHARRTLVAHHVPTRFLILEALPRTASLKVDLGAVRALFDAEPAPTPNETAKA